MKVSLLHYTYAISAWQPAPFSRWEMGWQSMMLMGVCIQSPATMSKNFLNLAGWFFLLLGSSISSSIWCIPVLLISVWKDLEKWTKVNAIIVVDTLIGNNKLIEVLIWEHRVHQEHREVTFDLRVTIGHYFSFY